MDLDDFNKAAKTLRRRVFEAFIETGEAHLGGSFSVIESLLYLYHQVLTSDDIFILSKAHASYPLLLILKDRGFDTTMKTHLEFDDLNGVKATTGSLGHGLPIGVGRALARKMRNVPGYVYVLISDGECQEGTTWESLLVGAHHQLDNMCIIVDNNAMQALGPTSEICNLGDLEEKFKVFGWSCIGNIDGHAYRDFETAFLNMHSLKGPKFLICNTVKGKGISEFENDSAWHAKKVRGNDIEIGRRRLSQ